MTHSIKVFKPIELIPRIIRHNKPHVYVMVSDISWNRNHITHYHITMKTNTIAAEIINVTKHRKLEAVEPLILS